jgi:uncharacterized phage protein gp47/JayE
MSVFPTPDQSLEYFQTAAPPLRVETVETILARIISDTNAGIEPTSPEYLDVTVGSIAHDFYAATAMEFDRVYDFASNEVVRAGIPTLAEGPYLDSWAESLGLERKDQAEATGTVTFTGTAGTIIPASTQVSTQAISPEVDPVVYETTEGGTIPEAGEITLAVKALNPGSEGNVMANTVTVLVTNIQPPEGSTSSVTAVANAEPMAGGTNVETDSELQTRVGQALGGTNGAGTIDDYTRWFLGEPSIGHVTVQAAWNGPNTVRVLVTDVNNNPFTSPAIVEALQAEWDPEENGNGAKKGPIGHIITIATPTGKNVTMTAVVTMEEGWSYDGTGGTRATRTPILEALQAYVASLKAGAGIVLYKAAAAIMDVEGVANLAGLMIGDTQTTTSVEYKSGETAVHVTSATGAVEGGKVVLIGGGNVAAATITHISGTTLTVASLGHTFTAGVVAIFATAADLAIPGADVAVLANVVLT